MKITFHVKSGVLTYNGKNSKVNTQVGRVLEFLSRRAGTVVSKEEILEECWKNRGIVVSLNALRQTLYRLRRALDEIEASNDILLTKGRNGYLLKDESIVVLYDDQESRDSEEGIPDENIIYKKESYLFLNSLSKFRKKSLSILYALIIATLFFGVGFYIRFAMMINTLEYKKLNPIGDLHVYLEKKSDLNETEIGEVLKKYYYDNGLSKEKLKYIFINGDEQDNISYFMCSGYIEKSSSRCESVVILKDFK
ncbi:winged helix-turn-helix domain-containing protein [Enterobacter cloacae]|uniref:winged helix-turn-helix domain-containing protein n=1 Tax=Enterobacter bugandensis TaxID=881260 RepID=UPI00200554D5|nr:winged helix-turn-helix domain-containing protein [Enterobacter bugandensis]EJC0567403.1 winged helix-turn-helix domain-containing protein [Enterobacter cloacae]MCK6898293.1 winged helix-turn-helix domain-containing protein [Enterobacter bugandensis]